MKINLLESNNHTGSTTLNPLKSRFLKLVIIYSWFTNTKLFVVLPMKGYLLFYFYFVLLGKFSNRQFSTWLALKLTSVFGCDLFILLTGLWNGSFYCVTTGYPYFRPYILIGIFLKSVKQREWVFQSDLIFNCYF